MKKKQQTPIQFGFMRGITDVVYVALFGKTTMGLLNQFGLPADNVFDDEDDALRDCLSIHALEALVYIEVELMRRFRTVEAMPDDWEIVINQVVETIGSKYKALAEKNGVDFLTGERAS